MVLLALEPTVIRDQTGGAICSPHARLLLIKAKFAFQHARLQKSRTTMRIMMIPLKKRTCSRLVIGLQRKQRIHLLLTWFSVIACVTILVSD